MKLILNLKKGNNLVIFTSPLILTNSSKIKVNKANILWTVYNVGVGESITVGSTEENVDRGYYSFLDLSSTLNVLGITVEINKAEHSVVSPPQRKND